MKDYVWKNTGAIIYYLRHCGPARQEIDDSIKGLHSTYLFSGSELLNYLSFTKHYMASFYSRPTSVTAVSSWHDDRY